MKTSLVIVFLVMFLSFCSTSQKSNSRDNTMEQTNQVNDLFMNETEGACLNKIFETTRNGFDFTNRKVGFIKGSSGKIKSNKEDYFDMQKKHSVNENYPCDDGTLYIFNADQKEESGGYDAAIVYWSKFLIPVEKVVKRLKEKR